jgi:hypothetical protein
METFPKTNLPRVTCLGLVAAGTMFALAAAAQESGPELGMICTGGFIKFCAGAIPGNRAVRNCMRQNFDKLSVECRTAIEQGLHELCAADVMKFCPGIKPGSGGILDCMQQNFDQLSVECRDGIEHGHKKNES